MSHYNDNERIKQSLASFDENIPIDILIVDDGSTVRPQEAELQPYFKPGKLRIVNMEKNGGCGAARNLGLLRITEMQPAYEFIGTMDSDDLNKPGRFRKQLEYLEKNTDIALIGSWIDCIDSKGNFLYTHKYPVKDKEIKKHMYVNSMFAHPTMLFRSEILKTVGFFPEKYRWSEDYAFVFNVSKKFKVENLPEALIYYTINEKGYSSKNRRAQVWDRLRIIKDNFEFGFWPVYGLLRNFPLLFMSREFLVRIKKLLRKNSL
ncbi:glycosyltransferase [Flavobacterium longum]|uniref:glycosyltransferase n=1 Tax=Flavobacterium longum TaxID=1299340 RepID=UPI0039E810F1